MTNIRYIIYHRLWSIVKWAGWKIFDEISNFCVSADQCLRKLRNNVRRRDWKLIWLRSVLMGFRLCPLYRLRWVGICYVAYKLCPRNCYALNIKYAYILSKNWIFQWNLKNEIIRQCVGDMKLKLSLYFKIF